MAAYITDADLRARLGLETYIALFDEANEFDRETGTVTAAMTVAVDAIIAGATARANAWLPNDYKGTLPFDSDDPENPLPELIKELTLSYAEPLSWKRNLDYQRSMGMQPSMDKLFAAADAMGCKIQKAALRLYDAANPVPANVGGSVSSGNANCPTPIPALFAFGKTGLF